MAKLCKHIMHKNSPKRNVIKDNYYSNKFQNYFLVEFTKFLDGILSSISKVISPIWESIFLLLEKAKYFLGKKINWRTLTWCQILLFWLSISLGLHIPPNLELIQRNWKLASYRKIKYLESNLVCVNVISLSLGKLNMILHMKYLEGFHKHPKIKIVATTFISMKRWKWMPLPCLLVNIQAAIDRNLLFGKYRAFWACRFHHHLHN